MTPANPEHSSGCLSILVSKVPPFLDKDEGVWSGPLFMILEALSFRLAKCFNLTEEAPIPGVMLPNGSFTGVVGKVQREEVDMVLAPLAVTHDRWQVVDFSQYLYILDQRIVYRRPFPQTDYTAMVINLPLMAWIMILMSILGVSAITLLDRTRIFTAQGVDGRNSRTVQLKKEENFTRNLHQSFYWAYGALLGQNLSLPTGGKTIGNAIQLWFLLAFFLASIYKSNMIAVVTSPKIKIPFRNLKEMVEQKQVGWTFVENSAVYSLFKSAAKDSTYGKVWEGSTGPVKYNLLENMRVVLEQNTALIIDPVTTRTMMGINFSQLQAERKIHHQMKP